MKGYKGMTKDMTCRGMKFEVGETYHVDGEIEICRNGLHFCRNIADVFEYYSKDDDSRYFEIETDSEVESDGNKSVTDTIKIIKELDDIEVNRALYGDGDGDGDGYGDGYGYGYGYGKNIQKVLKFNN